MYTYFNSGVPAAFAPNARTHNMLWYKINNFLVVFATESHTAPGITWEHTYPRAGNGYARGHVQFFDERVTISG